jgi:hypothetical protein
MMATAPFGWRLNLKMKTEKILISDEKIFIPNDVFVRGIDDNGSNS